MATTGLSCSTVTLLSASGSPLDTPAARSMDRSPGVFSARLGPHAARLSSGRRVLCEVGQVIVERLLERRPRLATKPIGIERSALLDQIRFAQKA